MKHQIKIICIILFWVSNSIYAHTIKILNNTDKKIDINLTYNNAYEELFEFLTIRNDTIFDLKPECIEYNLSFYLKHNKYFHYYAFIEDTILIYVNEATIKVESVNGYIQELNYALESKQFPKIYRNMMIETDRLSKKYSKKWYINDDKVVNNYLKFGKVLLTNELTRISKINFKNKKIKKYLLERSYLQYQAGILFFLINTVIEHQVFDDINPFKVYDSVVDHYLINKPNFANTYYYRTLIIKYSNLMQYYSSFLKKEFGKTENEINYIIFNNLDGIGKKAFIFHKTKILINKLKNKQNLLAFRKKIEISKKISNDIKQLLIQLLEKKISICQGESFPIKQFRDINGTMINFNDYKGKVVLLQFWATWCPHCKKEFLFYKKIMPLLTNYPVELLMISIDDDVKNWELIIETQQPLGKNICIGKGFINPQLNLWEMGIDGVPKLVILDKNGKIFSMSYYETIEKTINDIKKLCDK